MASWIVLRTFPSRSEGEMAKQLLQAYGIEAELRVRDGGTLYPPLHLQSGVDLLVKEEDEEAARDTLDSP